MIKFWKVRLGLGLHGWLHAIEVERRSLAIELTCPALDL